MTWFKYSMRKMFHVTSAYTFNFLEKCVCVMCMRCCAFRHAHDVAVALDKHQNCDLWAKFWLAFCHVLRTCYYVTMHVREKISLQYDDKSIDLTAVILFNFKV